MGNSKTGRVIASVLAISSVAWSGAASAHEPIFGVGPHTVFKGGLAVEIEGEFSEDEISNVYELAYGITPDLTVTGKLPLVRVDEGGTSRSGFGDGLIRLKWRFFRVDSPGSQESMAIVGGIKLPTGSTSGPLPLGTGSTDWIGALTYGHEGRRWYWWGDVRYLLTTEDEGVNRGDVFFYDAAFGVRPWLLRYDQPDLVVLAEVNGRHIGAADAAGGRVPDTGGDIVTVGPAIFFTYRNYGLKAGVAFPMSWSLDGTQPNPGTEGTVALEGHF